MVAIVPRDAKTTRINRKTQQSRFANILHRQRMRQVGPSQASADAIRAGRPRPTLSSGLHSPEGGAALAAAEAWLGPTGRSAAAPIDHDDEVHATQ
jgi:hypothetical protein